MTDARTDEWVDLGLATTGVPMLAICSPLDAGALAQWWAGYQEHLNAVHRKRIACPDPANCFDPEHRENRPAYRQVMLPTTWSRGSQYANPAVLFDTYSSGGYRVQGRFIDPYGLGELELAEVRILLIDEDRVLPEVRARDWEMPRSLNPGQP